MVSKEKALVFEEEILVPRDRVKVFIGEKGATRKGIEKKGNVKLWVDIANNSVKIIAKDALELMAAKNVVEAIARGFSPVLAQKLFKEENGFELLDLQDYGAREKKDMIRLRGVVIGTEGRVRSRIEQYTNTDVSVYGKTIGIIGEIENAALAREAFRMLLTGRHQGSVFRFLEGARKNAG